MKRIIIFFDKLEDRVRHRLSRQPLLYALIGGVGVVIFWRGVWHGADYLSASIQAVAAGDASIGLGSLPWWDAIASMLIGGSLLLMTGAFVSSFIGNEMIISGLKGEKKIAEKTEAEVRTEAETVRKIEKEMEKMSRRLAAVEEGLENRSSK